MRIFNGKCHMIKSVSNILVVYANITRGLNQYLQIAKCSTLSLNALSQVAVAVTWHSTARHCRRDNSSMCCINRSELKGLLMGFPGWNVSKGNFGIPQIIVGLCILIHLSSQSSSFSIMIIRSVLELLWLLFNMWLYRKMFLLTHNN